MESIHSEAFNGWLANQLHCLGRFETPCVLLCCRCVQNHVAISQRRAPTDRCNSAAAAVLCAVLCMQGSSCCRTRMRFVTHDHSPPTLAAAIKPDDVEGIHSCCLPGIFTTSYNANSSSSSCGAQPADGALRRTGSFVLYQDSTRTLTVTGQGSSGKNHGLELTVELAPAGSEVITIAPLLEWQLSSSNGNGGGHASYGCDGGSGVLFAAVGLTNMLNPGGAIRGVAEVPVLQGSSAGAQSGNGQGTNKDSRGRRDSGSSSGSWVVAGEEEGAAGLGGHAAEDEDGKASFHGSAAPLTSDNNTADAAAAAGVNPGTGVLVSVLGCGQLLLYASERPLTVVLDGHEAVFRFDSSTSSVVVDIPVADVGDDISGLEHSVVVVFRSQ